MFSKDPKHYRPAPRTVSQAFGPYHKFEEAHRRSRFDILCAVAGVLLLGAAYGLLFAWRG